MANISISGSVIINLLVNGDNLNTTLNSTAPLYQTFKKGTTDFKPNWGTMPQASQPVVFPRIYSVMEGELLTPTDVSWKYNQVPIVWGPDNKATSPSIIAGKVEKITYNGAEALRMIGNVASDTNNDSDTITFTGSVDSSGQRLTVSSDITVLVEEGTNNLYRLLLVMVKDVFEPGQASLQMQAMLYNSGTLVSNNVEFQFSKLDGSILRGKDPDSILTLSPDDVDGELVVIGKAYVNGELVGQEQKQVFDSTDPFVIVCDQGDKVEQRAKTDIAYKFSLMNARTGSKVSSATFDIKVYNRRTITDITSEFTFAPPTITIPGSKIKEHRSISLNAVASTNV